MARYRFEDKLRLRADEFIRALEKAGLDAILLDDTFREYSVKVGVKGKGAGYGAAVLYYKPKSDSFTLSTHELKDRLIAGVLEDCWHSQPGDSPGGNGYEIYVDGSFTGGATGYGAVILKDGRVIEELFGVIHSSEAAGTYQIAGELAAVKEALKWCGTHSVNEVTIYYDYLGIEKWATGKWKTNQYLTQEYARYVRDCPVKIQWRKVDSHTGNRWNDRADLLAKRGAGLNQTGAVLTNLIGALLEKCDAWIEFLMVKGVEAYLDQVYNEQFARVVIVKDDKAVGTFDLYNTRKKRFSPYLHDFRDEELKLRIESLWKEFSAATG